MTNEERQQALEAGSILASPVFNKVLERMDNRFVAIWRKAKDPDARERAWMMQHLLASLKKELFDMLQGAAFTAGGKDKELNAALKTAKEKKNG